MFSGLTRARFSPGRVIAPKKARIVQQQQLKKVSAGVPRVGDGEVPVPWASVSSFVRWVRKHLVANGPLKAGIGARKSVHMLAAFSKLSMLINLEKTGSLGKESERS